MHHLSKLVTDSPKLTIDDRVCSLTKLHHVLEMTAMLQQCLNLPPQLISTAARSAFVQVFVWICLVFKQGSRSSLSVL